MLLDAMRQAERREAFREALDLQAELVELLPADDARWLEVLEAMYCARGVADRPPRRDACAGRDPGAASDRRPARGVCGLRPPGHGQVPPGQLPGLGRRASSRRRRTRASRRGELFARAGDERQALLAAREVGWIKGLRGDLAGMAATPSAWSPTPRRRRRSVCRDAGTGRGRLQRATSAARWPKGRRRFDGRPMIAREDEKAYRLTVVLGVLAAGVAGQGRAAEAIDAGRGGQVRQPRLPGQHPGRARGAGALDRRGLPDGR